MQLRFHILIVQIPKIMIIISILIIVILKSIQSLNLF